jgi:hypothetical protein
MKQVSTLFLKGVILVITLLVLAFCLIALPTAIRGELTGDFDYAPLLFGLYLPAFPFLFALFQAFKLLGNIDNNIAFSENSIKSIKYIKYSSLLISALFTAGMPYIFYLAQLDDAPGVAAIGFIIIGASFVVAVFAAVLQKLIQTGLALKSENDLTV